MKTSVIIGVLFVLTMLFGVAALIAVLKGANPFWFALGAVICGFPLVQFQQIYSLRRIEERMKAQAAAANQTTPPQKG